MSSPWRCDVTAPDSRNRCTYTALRDTACVGIDDADQSRWRGDLGSLLADRVDRRGDFLTGIGPPPIIRPSYPEES